MASLMKARIAGSLPPARAVQRVLGALRVAANGAGILGDRPLRTALPEIGAATLEEGLGVAGIEPQSLLVAAKCFAVVLGFAVCSSAVEPRLLPRRIGGDGAVEVRDRLLPSARFVESQSFFERPRRPLARAEGRQKKNEQPAPPSPPPPG